MVTRRLAGQLESVVVGLIELRVTITNVGRLTRHLHTRSRPVAILCCVWLGLWRARIH